MFKSIDAIVVGAGPAGCTAARTLADKNKRVLIIEKRNHIAGNCYDELTENGIYVHKYGPHIFHTNNKNVWDYLSKFTDWYYYHHEVLGLINGKKVPIPFNLNTIEALFPPTLSEKLISQLIDNYGFGSRVPILELRKNKELNFLADYIYENVFLYYSAKQWGQNPDEIDPSVSARVPVVVSRDNRYFHDAYQGIPTNGYTNLFSKMIEHKNIKLLLNTDARDVIHIKSNEVKIDGRKYTGKVIYTGMIDELFNFSEGLLPYRSTNMVFETHTEDFYQENSLVNYPNNYDFTRISEHKYFQKNKNEIRGTVICKEYPQEFIYGKNDPYYIVKNPENEKRYASYLDFVDKIDNLYMIGRLANYKYYNMDEVVETSLKLASEIVGD